MHIYDILLILFISNQHILKNTLMHFTHTYAEQ